MIVKPFIEFVWQNKAVTAYVGAPEALPSCQRYGVIKGYAFNTAMRF